MPTDILFFLSAISIACLIGGAYHALESLALRSSRRKYARAVAAKEPKAPAGRGRL